MTPQEKAELVNKLARERFSRMREAFLGDKRRRRLGGKKRLWGKAKSWATRRVHIFGLTKMPSPGIKKVGQTVLSTTRSPVVSIQAPAVKEFARISPVAPAVKKKRGRPGKASTAPRRRPPRALF